MFPIVIVSKLALELKKKKNPTNPAAIAADIKNQQ